MFWVADRIKNSEINIKLVVMNSNIDTIIRRDKQRSGDAYVGEERIRQIVENFNSDIIPERYILKNDDANIDNLVNTVLNERRFTLQ